MADAKQIEQELREYLSKEDNMRKSDKIVYLMAIINKHFELDKIDHMINYSDFDLLISNAKASYPGSTAPVFLSKREVHYSISNHLLVLEAFIGYLNRNKLLKKLVRFDYRR